MREGWSYKKLGEVTQQISGLWTGKKPPFVTIPVISLSCFTKDCLLNYDKAPDIEIEERHLPSKQLQYGDIIIEKSGGSDTQPVGRPAFFSLKEGVYSFCTFTAALRVVDPKIDKSYLHKFLLARYRQGATFSLQSKTTGIHNLNFKSYLTWNVPIPPLTTQQHIVSELGLLSHILDQKRQQLKEYDALAESIFYDMFGDPVENPKGWEVKKLESLVSINSKLVDPKIAPYCEMYHVGPANIISGTGEIVDVKKAKEETLISGKYIFEEGMILYSKIRPALNKVTLANMHGLCSADMYPLSPNIEIVNAFFLKYVLSGPAFLKYAIEQSGRARMPKINREALFAFEFPLPPLSLQQSFAAKIESIEHQKQLLRASIKETEMLFQSRMDYWFNG